MTVNREQVQVCVFRALEAFNASEERAVPVTPDAVLLGAGGAVDSLGLVRLILVVERQVESDLGAAVSLTSERAMSQRNSPFRSVGALIDFITSSLNGEAG
jgi:acyl carrier protein